MANIAELRNEIISLKKHVEELEEKIISLTKRTEDRFKVLQNATVSADVAFENIHAAYPTLPLPSRYTN